MNLADIDIHRAAREHLVANGVDPDADGERSTFDLAEHMVTSAMHLLNVMVPPMFADAEPDHRAVVAWVDAFLSDSRQASNLLLLGPTGSGKSHQAYGALRRIVLAAARDKRRFQWRVTTFSEFNAAMRPRPDDAHVQDLEEFQSAELLLLDDLGAGVTSNWTDDNLHRLIDHRWSHLLPTIITTNLSGGDVAARFDERVVSRLRASAQVVFKGPDRRVPLGGVA